MANGVVYIGSDFLYAFNATTGATLSGWPEMTASGFADSPALANGVVYVGSVDDHSLRL